MLLSLFPVPSPSSRFPGDRETKNPIASWKEVTCQACPGPLQMPVGGSNLVRRPGCCSSAGDPISLLYALGVYRPSPR